MEHVHVHVHVHVIMIILTTWGCKQKMPDDKLGCVQMTHVCYTHYFTASQGCINYTCVSRTIILSAQVTVGRWCDTVTLVTLCHSWPLVWHLTCHRTSQPDIFLRSNTCSFTQTSCMFVFLVVMCQRASVTDIYPNTSKIPYHWPSEKLTQKCVSNIFPYHWNTRFGHIGMWLPSATNWHAMAGQMDRGQIWHN